MDDLGLRNVTVATAVMLLIVGVGVIVLRGTPALVDVAAGLLLAFLNGLAGAVINHRAIGRGDRAFLSWSVAGHGSRVALLLAAILAAPRCGIHNFTVFLAVTAVGYCCYLAFEIATLNRRSNTA